MVALEPLILTTQLFTNFPNYYTVDPNTIQFGNIVDINGEEFVLIDSTQSYGANNNSIYNNLSSADIQIPRLNIGDIIYGSTIRLLPKIQVYWADNLLYFINEDLFNTNGNMIGKVSDILGQDAVKELEPISLDVTRIDFSITRTVENINPPIPLIVPPPIVHKITISFSAKNYIQDVSNISYQVDPVGGLGSLTPGSNTQKGTISIDNGIVSCPNIVSDNFTTAFPIFPQPLKGPLTNIPVKYGSVNTIVSLPRTVRILPFLYITELNTPYDDESLLNQYKLIYTHYDKYRKITLNLQEKFSQLLFNFNNQPVQSTNYFSPLTALYNTFNFNGFGNNYNDPDRSGYIFGEVLNIVIISFNLYEFTLEKSEDPLTFLPLPYTTGENKYFIDGKPTTTSLTGWLNNINFLNQFQANLPKYETIFFFDNSYPDTSIGIFDPPLNEQFDSWIRLALSITPTSSIIKESFYTTFKDGTKSIFPIPNYIKERKDITVQTNIQYNGILNDISIFDNLIEGFFNVKANVQ